MPDSDHEDHALARLAAERIEAGLMPARTPDDIWAGPGAETECHVCCRTIATTDTEFELEFCTDSGFGKQVFHMHQACYLAWDRERKRRAAAGAPGCVLARLTDVAPRGIVLARERGTNTAS